MGFKVTGMLAGKKYSSRAFETEKEALQKGYALSYTKDGNKKRKRGLYNWEIQR